MLIGWRADNILTAMKLTINKYDNIIKRIPKCLDGAIGLLFSNIKNKHEASVLIVTSFEDD